MTIFPTCKNRNLRIEFFAKTSEHEDVCWATMAAQIKLPARTSAAHVTTDHPSIQLFTSPPNVAKCQYLSAIRHYRSDISLDRDQESFGHSLRMRRISQRCRDSGHALALLSFTA
jgi:hypothetical protein